MKNIAYVKEISGDNAVLNIKRECMCGGNSTNNERKCGAKCFTLADDTIETEIYNNIGAKAGEYVEIEGNTRAVLAYSAAAFILPVFTGLALYFIIDYFINNIFMPYIISGAGFILSMVSAYYFIENTAKKRKAGDFKITKIIKIGEDNE